MQVVICVAAGSEQLPWLLGGTRGCGCWCAVFDGSCGGVRSNSLGSSVHYWIDHCRTESGTICHLFAWLHHRTPITVEADVAVALCGPRIRSKLLMIYMCTWRPPVESEPNTKKNQVPPLERFVIASPTRCEPRIIISRVVPLMLKHDDSRIQSRFVRGVNFPGHLAVNWNACASVILRSVMLRLN